MQQHHGTRNGYKAETRNHRITIHIYAYTRNYMKPRHITESHISVDSPLQCWSTTNTDTAIYLWLHTAVKLPETAARTGGARATAAALCVSQPRSCTAIRGCTTITDRSTNDAAQLLHATRSQNTRRDRLHETAAERA